MRHGNELFHRAISATLHYSILFLIWFTGFLLDFIYRVFEISIDIAVALIRHLMKYLSNHIGYKTKKTILNDGSIIIIKTPKRRLFRR